MELRARKPNLKALRPVPVMLLAFAIVFVLGHYSGRGFAVPAGSAIAAQAPAGPSGTTRPRTNPSACSKLYVDVGSNIGDSIENFARGLIEAFRMVDIANLTSTPFDPSEFCVFGFEGNPKWTPTLKEMEARLRSTFRSLNILTETVADVKNGTATLFLDTVNEDRNNWGSSMIEGHRDVQSSGKKGVDVAAVDLAQFLKEHAQPMEGKEVDFAKRLVIVRMDIEGMEYPILQKLVSTGLLCNTADFWLIEWHWMVVEGEQQQDFAKKTEVFRWLLDDPRCHSKLLKH